MSSTPTQSIERTSSENLLEAGSIVLKEIMECPDNRKCFDCVDADSPRYVCFPFSTFVCSCCAVIHKETFGHPIKCLNVFLFSASDISLLQEASNKIAADKWLAKWTPSDMPEPNPSSPTYQSDAKAYIKAKYIEKKWYDEPVPMAVQATDSVAEKTTDDKATSPMFRASAFLSPPLMCPYMPPVYPVINYVQYPTPEAPHFYSRAAPVPVQYMDQQSIGVSTDTEETIPLSSSSIINMDPNKPYYAHPYSPSPTDFKRPLFPHSLSPREYSPPTVAVSTSPPSSTAFALSPQHGGPLARSTTGIIKPSSPVQQSLHRSVSDTQVGANSPRKPDLKVSPLSAHKNIDKSAIRQKFKVYTIMSKMAGLLSPKKQEN